ncbi:MAG: flagella-associated protein [Chlamydiales bacterium]|jgi:flagellar biosynthesis protein FlhA|nr:flagella-associated protein [Chlamydiales bacterium]
MLGSLSQKVNKLYEYSDVVLALSVVCIVLLLVIPLPPILLDVLLSISIVLSVTTLLMTMYIHESLDFSSFPSLLLFLTLFRLSLNIASTRMILAEAQAGDIIETFGNFVTGGNQVVGAIIFILLTIVNFVVITKGSGRVAEVAARFTLDAMPGKQMSIDADLNAGLIDEQEAKVRREKIALEADFYGAMDGASKFVRGDAIAGIIMTIVNVIGGFIIGIAMKGMNWKEALHTYTTLTVGDGLVSQIPSLLISVGAGILVTRASSKEKLSNMIHQQVFNNPRVLYLTSIVVFVLGMVPGMPLMVITPISIAIGLYAYSLQKMSHTELGSLDTTLAKTQEVEQAQQQAETVEKALFIDPMEIELGYTLIPLVDQSQGGDLLNRITVIRRQIASELGLIVPPIRIRDNMSLDPNSYIIKIKGIDVASGTLQIDSYLAMNPGNVSKPIPGIKTTEPAFGLPAIWISAGQKENAELLGYTVVDTLSVLATHLTEVIHVYAHELLNRQEVSRLIDNAKTYAPAVIEELIPARLSLGQVVKVQQNLLRERIPIRDIVTILEILADQSSRTTDTDILTEYVRQGLARSISKQYGGDKKILYAITFDPKVEQMMAESVQKSDFGHRIVLRPTTTQKIIDELDRTIQESAKQGLQPIVLTSPSIRLYVKHLIERGLPRLPVVSFNEVVSEVEIQAVGVVSSEVLI